MGDKIIIYNRIRSYVDITNIDNESFKLVLKNQADVVVNSTLLMIIAIDTLESLKHFSNKHFDGNTIRNNLDFSNVFVVIDKSSNTYYFLRMNGVKLETFNIDNEKIKKPWFLEDRDIFIKIGLSINYRKNNNLNLKPINITDLPKDILSMVYNDEIVICYNDKDVLALKPCNKNNFFYILQNTNIDRIKLLSSIFPTPDFNESVILINDKNNNKWYISFMDYDDLTFIDDNGSSLTVDWFHKYSHVFKELFSNGTFDAEFNIHPMFINMFTIRDISIILPEGYHIDNCIDLSDSVIEKLPNRFSVEDELNMENTNFSYIPYGLKADVLIVRNTPLSKFYSKDEIMDIIQNKNGYVENIIIE